MPNAIGPTGLTTATKAELVAQFTADMQAIYGPDINLDPDTPDGQMMNIFIQSILDMEDLLTQIYNMFDPDNAVGEVLDQRVAINGIQRQGGTFTTTDVTIVFSSSVNLYGLDQDVQPVYTVADNAGNKWELLVTQLGITPGTHTYVFQSAVPGEVLTIPNTITVPVTIVLGVDSVNNPTTYNTLGINEETDAALKIRRQKSVSIGSQGYLAGLYAALANLTGMVSVFIYENVSDTPDGDGVPGHSIWVIVEGTAAPVDIATAIYLKRNAGCGMFGDQTYDILQVDSTFFTIKWDNVESEDLFIKFNVDSIDGITPPNVDAIRTQLPEIFVPGVNEEVNINALATAVQQIDPNTLVTLAGFSTTYGGSYTNTLAPSAKNKRFAVSSPNITILPILLVPSEATVAALGTQQFQAFGGHGSYTWSMDSNPSGGSVDSSGLYTAGSTGSVTDVVKVTDADSNDTTGNITVT